MHTPARIVTTLLFSALLVACGKDDPAPAPATSASSAEPQTALGRVVNKAIDEARTELAKENVGLSSSQGGPKAEITPKGDLLIDGKAFAIDEKQRALLLEYRKHTHAIAEAGMEIGVQGADLGGKAIGEALGSVFSGKTEEMEKRIEAEAKGIEASAIKLCELLPGLLKAQNELAASLPAFEPYAKMTQSDVDDCRTDAGKGGDGKAIGKVIESAFNEKIDIKVDVDTSSPDSKSAAAEAEAASAASAPAR
jgi:hypothetical protein